MTDPLAGREVVLDTGPLVALLDPRDSRHHEIMEHWPALVNRCITTEAVLVEATHLVARGRGNPARVLEFLVAADIPVFAMHLPAHLECIHMLRRYADTPMDYADATLMVLADHLRLTAVFTLDRRGFGSYRGARGTGLDVVPS